MSSKTNPSPAGGREPKPDSPAAVAFLHDFEPNGPWVLTAIRPDRKAIETKTFTAERQGQLKAWLEKFNGDRNIYFHVNPTISLIDKKAERKDVKALAWLHVDVDPRAGEDLDEERARCRELFDTKLPDGVPPPTIVIFSGGGYQGFWRLKEPFPIDGDLDRAEEAKLWNKQLEVLFQADNCHNVDRIMRLPGTINLPDARKLKKGRVPTLATLAFFDAERVYDLEKFTKAAPVREPGGGLGEAYKVELPSEVDRLVTIDELDQWGVPDRVKIICVQGHLPDDPKEGDQSRSAWLFDAICQLVRYSVPDDSIFSIITDPKYAISASVLDKGANAEKYAVRQIQRGREFVVDPVLAELNDQFAVIGSWGGRCVVVEEIMDHALGRTRLTRQSFSDFRNRFMHRRVKVGEDMNGKDITKQVGKWWLENPLRRQFDTIVFAPGQDVPTAYNLWQGFAVEPKEGDCSLFLDHVRDNVCQGDEEIYRYVLSWMARAVQRPNEPGEVAIVLRGGRGVGKSLFAKEFGKIFGRHFLQVTNPSHLVGNFNAHLQDVVVLFADEAFYAGDKKHASMLKTLITEETLNIERKGIDTEVAPNYVHLIMASNDDWVVPAGRDERRFLVLDVGEDKKQDEAYFGAIVRQMKSGGREALLHELQGYDLEGYSVRKVPQTKALQAQKELSGDPLVTALIRVLEDGFTPDDDYWKPAPEWMSVEGLMSMLDESERRSLSIRTRAGHLMNQAAQITTRTAKGSTCEVAVTKTCERLLIVDEADRPIRRIGRRSDARSNDKVIAKRRRMYRLRPLQDLREKFGGDHPWPTEPRTWLMGPSEGEKSVEQAEMSALEDEMPF